jgi:hypothetical protein
LSIDTFVKEELERLNRRLAATREELAALQQEVQTGSGSHPVAKVRYFAGLLKII